MKLSLSVTLLFAALALFLKVLAIEEGTITEKLAYVARGMTGQKLAYSPRHLLWGAAR